MNLIGKQVGGLAAIALGAFILSGDDFATPWEQVPVTSMLRGLLAYLTGAILIAAGVAMFRERLARVAALVLIAISLGFTLLWFLEVAHRPEAYDPWGNVAEQSSVAAGFLAIFASLAQEKTDNMFRLAIVARLWFGLCSLSFGVVHFLNIKACAGFVPNWMPFGGVFWTIFTGFAHFAAALAILSGVWAFAAARLAALMYLGFGLLGWGNVLLARPTDHFAWGGEIITFTLVAAVWMIGDSISLFPPKDGQLFLPRRP